MSQPLQPGPVTAQDWFEDVTQDSGIQFHHETGPVERYQIPDQMGSGAAFLDVNNDGLLDIFLAQQGGTNATSTHRLYQQAQDGTFQDVTQDSGLALKGQGTGVAAGDVNNDGWTDLLLVHYGSLQLFLNQTNGTFRDVTRQAGLDNPRWGTSAAFFDYDRDGWLDLVVANYLEYNPTQACTDAVGNPEFCGPHGFPGLATRLFRNLGQGRFEDVSVTSGLARFPGPALGVVCLDINGDRWPDIFLADDGRPNRAFINQQDGTFEEEAAIRGLAYNSMGQTAGDMGVALGDVNQDGLFDLFITHLAEEQHALWLQGPRGLFRDRTAQSGLNVQGWRGTGFGAVFLDAENDGDLDLAFVNGRVKRGRDELTVDPATPAFWKPYAQYHQLFRNNGEGRFEDVSLGNSAFTGNASVGRGLACGDLDNDGDLDLLTTSVGGPTRLFRNISDSQGHWLLVRVVDPAHGGRDAYGAEVTIHAGQRQWWGLVQPAYSYLCSNDPRVHVGLGNTASIDRIQVIWPDGVAETFTGSDVDRLRVLRKGEGQTEGSP